VKLELKVLFFLLIACQVYSLSELVEVVAKARSCVVFIACEENPFDASYPDPWYFQELYLKPLYNYFWPSLFSHGSGALISEQGHILTSAHVLGRRTKVLVFHRREDGACILYPTTVEGCDISTDVALLKITSDEKIRFPYLKFGNSDTLQPGQSILAIGNPSNFDLDTTVTHGIVSAMNRHFIFPDDRVSYIQANAAFNLGDSGGPLLDSQGDIIGVVNSGLWRYQNLCFFTPSYVAEKITNQILEIGEIKHAKLGVSFENDMICAFDGIFCLESYEGARVRAVNTALAKKAGLEMGDRILKVDGYVIPSAKALENRLYVMRPNSTVQLTIDRNGEELTLAALLDID
jgi:S1-C subfamily serine protease